MAIATCALRAVLVCGAAVGAAAQLRVVGQLAGDGHADSDGGGEAQVPQLEQAVRSPPGAPRQPGAATAMAKDAAAGAAEADPREAADARRALASAVARSNRSLPAAGMGPGRDYGCIPYENAFCTHSNPCCPPLQCRLASMENGWEVCRR